ncbi:MAG TPA: chemotaxis protein CheB [Humisphaera sp.]|jgi:two-component system CheB/CheR fusion protein|nr:chemotaxis protein CheB [Humisphaera sp.]
MRKKIQTPRRKTKVEQPPRRNAQRPKTARANGPKSNGQPALDVVADAPSVSTLPSFTIVGIGASAGGLEACSDLLRALSPQSAFAVVIVQHMAPEHDSFLPGLLAGVTSLPVVQVKDGLRINPGHVYVVPPNVQMEIIGGQLRLQPRPSDRTQHLPIDYFFRSLAEYAQSRAIGVVLSGTASDGSIGVREIKAAGGITFAQEPRTAKYDGMPRAAIATGAVDLVMAPTQIAMELERISRDPLTSPLHAPRVPTDDSALLDEHMARIFSMLRTASGVDFTHYKLPTIRRRLQRRMVLHKIESLDKYIKYLQTNPAEVQSLYQDILIHVTRFFRDPESFEVLARQVFPKILEARVGESPIRVWIPGCSTGEEAYSAAIALLEFLAEKAAGKSVQIFATDVSESAVEQARAGVYPESISADVSPERLRRYFTRTDGSYRIAKAVRDLCVFARQDLTRDPPFSKLDLILCRNVLIYLGPQLQKKLMNVFHYALKPTGFLMLGTAETTGASSDLFVATDKRHKIFTKNTVGARADMDFPHDRSESHIGEPRRAVAIEHRSSGNIQNEANRVLLSRYSPPGVLVNSDLQIVQFRGQTGAFLEPAPGEASLDVLKMAREGLLYGLRSALMEARKTDLPVRKRGLNVRQNDGIARVDLEVIPVTSASEGRHFLVLFQQPGTAPAEERPALKGAKKKSAVRGKRETRHDADRISRLEQELAASREYLQSMIQDLEAANEELQSANEEILSSNEELQSTNEELDTAKEELQSTNEELNTVNEELQGRNEELSRVNSDLVNLLGSVQIAIVMVAGDLRIRRFTPMAERVLNLIPTDLGRPISDIKPNIDCPDLESLITDSIESMSIRERECRDRHGRRYLLRVRPYKNVENRIDGAVLALFDIAESPRRLDAGDGDREATVGTNEPSGN